MPRGSAAWTVLALVRHGQSRGNVDGVIGGHSATPLTDLGHRQARATADFLHDDFGPTHLVSSDLLRARQTALPIAQECGLELTFDERLRERSLGVLDGMAFNEVQERYPDLWKRLRARDPGLAPPKGETVEAVYQRVSAVIEHLVQTYPGGRVVVVSHGIAIYHAFCHICSIGSPADGMKVFTLVDNCSVTRATYRGDYWYLSTLNERAHLDLD